MTQQVEQRNCRVASSIDILNDDILLKIFDYIHLDDKIKLRRTCYRWKLLLDYQLNQLKALRIGCFQQGGYNVTSGLNIQCEHFSSNHRRHTGTLFNQNMLNFPADLETQCFSIKRYDFLHRALKYSHQSITMLSLGQISVSYRLLMVITHNLPNLEHFELINCASDISGARKERNSSKMNISDALRPPSLEFFNTEQQDDIYSMTIYNQHQDEEINMGERLIRSSFVQNCDLVKEAKAKKHWPRLKHLLIKECNLLNEFSLSLILAITSQTLVHLVIESNQYLTGEFLNYCGPNLKILRLKYCPLMQIKFLKNFVKIKQLLAQQPSPQTSSLPFLTSNNKSLRNCNQDIYCVL